MRARNASRLGLAASASSASAAGSSTAKAEVASATISSGASSTFAPAVRLVFVVVMRSPSQVWPALRLFAQARPEFNPRIGLAGSMGSDPAHAFAQLERRSGV
jgi:hypothetical protein